MNLLILILLWALVFAMVCWIVSKIPFPAPPAAPAWLPNLVYIVVGIFFLLLLVDLIGWIDLGWHPVIIERHGR